MWGGELVTCVTLTGVEGVLTAAPSAPSSAESVEESASLARADLRGDTLALGEAGAGEAEAEREPGVESFVTDSDLEHNMDTTHHYNTISNISSYLDSDFERDLDLDLE